MSDAKKVAPAQKVAGQRRKFGRRDRPSAGPPRSNTMPALNPGSATASLVSSVSTVGTAYTQDRESEDSYHQHPAQGHMDPQGHDDKVQKHGLFDPKKLQALVRSSGSNQKVLKSPLPASTPTKAARFFGLDSKTVATFENPHRTQLYDADVSEDLPVRAPPNRRVRFAGLTDPEQEEDLKLLPKDMNPLPARYRKTSLYPDRITVPRPLTRASVQASLELHGSTPRRSPLQKVEDTYLDATEQGMELEARKATLDKLEAEKQEMDAKIAHLRREHEKMKLDFNAAVTRAEESKTAATEEVDDDDDDLISLNSSIDLDEEPTVHEANVVTFTRVTPGMVKLVDIPPRKKKPASHVDSTITVPDKPAPDLEKTLAAPASAENVSPPLVTNSHCEDPDCTDKPKKGKLARDKSRLLVQNWVWDYNKTEQRPVSTRIDPDVLADQETPPAPFPKGDEDLRTPPIQSCSESLQVPQPPPKHQCFNNSHVFHPVDLKTMPYDTAVNTFETKSYIQAYTGIEQHVKIPVLCEKCAEDCDGNVWECEIVVCRMVVCQTCAEAMEAEWQQKAISGYKSK